MDLGGWLRSLGLEQYEAAFRTNAIDSDVLGELTDQDFEKLGLLLGHRRKLLRAIAALDDAVAPATAPPPAPSPTARDQRSADAASENDLEVQASGEYEHGTVMFCGLVDSSGFSPSPDAEEWRDLVGAYLDAASIAVTEWDGRVAKKFADGLIAQFGYPVMQEDDLECAVQAARAIQRSLTELNKDGGPTLAVRIVIESGPMVIDARNDIFGELPNVAAGAQAVAEPNTPTVAARRRQIPTAEERDSHKRKSSPRLNPTVSDGHPMSYRQLIARAVAGLEKNTGEARRALYERARKALLSQLRSNQPVLVLADITKERLALEEAIRKVEAEAARNLRTEAQTETQDLRSAAPAGGTPDGGGKAASTPPRRERPNPPWADLPGAEWSAVLFSARERLLSARSSTKKQAVRRLGDVVGDLHEVGTGATEAAKAARQTRDAYEPEAPDLNSNDYDTQQQRGHERPYAPEEDEPVVLPPGYTRSAPEKQNEAKSRRQLSYPTSPSLPRPNWSLPLPCLLVVSGVMTVATLNDARVLIEQHLSAESRAKEMWRYVSNELREAAIRDDTAKFSSVLEMALSLEGLEWALK